jgi:hypothetical protein
VQHKALPEVQLSCCFKVSNAVSNLCCRLLHAAPAVKVCAGLPEFQINSAGWPDSCANRTHGFVCNGTCAGNSTGRILAQCVAGNWQVNATATCARKFAGNEQLRTVILYFNCKACSNASTYPA